MHVVIKIPIICFSLPKIQKSLRVACPHCPDENKQPEYAIFISMFYKTLTWRKSCCNSPFQEVLRYPLRVMV